MKFIILVFTFVIIGCCSQKVPAPSIVAVEPILAVKKLLPVNPRGNINFGRLSAFLMREDGSIISKDSELFGECKTCARGFSVENFIGVRLEGGNVQDLKISRKQSSEVKIIDCPQNTKIDKEFKCKFELNHKNYILKLLLKNNEF